MSAVLMACLERGEPDTGVGGSLRGVVRKGHRRRVQMTRIEGRKDDAGAVSAQRVRQNQRLNQGGVDGDEEEEVADENSKSREGTGWRVRGNSAAQQAEGERILGKLRSQGRVDVTAKPQGAGSREQGAGSVMERRDTKNRLVEHLASRLRFICKRKVRQKKHGLSAQSTQNRTGRGRRVDEYDEAQPCASVWLPVCLASFRFEPVNSAAHCTEGHATWVTVRGRRTKPGLVLREEADREHGRERLQA
ncbi:hypothetical protein PHSY_004080 [Pseudozyma hubeiensis SY62]|uniref:Uncharacterized protein n=1 Tax=Pseudozyma hubeiensis (strain SY62) TaxID=1305764 RepID=R9PEH6_PSEHS|nr:hypothetical protein PHSY_004080 [Pseudozyma hubeiensis SY62]GAC96500.1 hypothetical protein PHSY_004080 [Pseudozyma hubeiensis SY62]